MRITRSGGQIAIRDRAGPFWFLGLFLLSGGALAVAMPLGLASNAEALAPWERLACIGMGLGVSAGALWWLARSPATQVQLDLTRRRVLLTRLGLTGRQARQFSFDEVERTEIEVGSDSDGGTVWRPAIHLRDGQRILLSELWSHDRGGVERGVAAIAEACHLRSRSPRTPNETGMRNDAS
jgi:hypothetical protein